MKTERTDTHVRRRVAITLAILLVVGLVSWGGRAVAPHLLPLIEHAQSLGPLAPVGFVAIYAIAMVALIPASVLTLAGGAVFGFGYGVLWAMVGSTLGSTSAFLIGRYVARRAVRRRLASMPRFAAIERAVSERGRRIVMLLRLSPIAPFNFLNYALGLTTISVVDFMAASIGTIPGTVAYAYAGKVAGEALVFAGTAQLPRNASYYALLVAGLAATVVATTVVTRTARRALRDV